MRKCPMSLNNVTSEKEYIKFTVLLLFHFILAIYYAAVSAQSILQ